MIATLIPLVVGAALGSAPAPLAELVIQPAGPPTGRVEEFRPGDTLSDDELAGQRGGFSWKGVEIALGAEMRTFLNGELVLQTNISWTAAGAQTSQTVSGALSQVEAAQLQAGILSSGGITMRIGDQSVFLANGGNTAIIHGTQDGFQNVVVNRASNIDVRQEVDAVLDLQNFGSFQQQLFSERLGNSVGDMVGQATIGGLSN